MAVRVRVDGTMVLAVLAAAGAGYVWYRSSEIAESASEAADEAVGAVNPADKRNLINRSFNWWYGTLTGSEGTLGSDLAKVVHGTPTINPASDDDPLEEIQRGSGHSVYGEDPDHETDDRGWLWGWFDS